MGDDRVVGFVMANFDAGNEIDASRAHIWRLNIAGSEQGLGSAWGTAGSRSMGVAQEARRRGQTRITVF